MITLLWLAGCFLWITPELAVDETGDPPGDTVTDETDPVDSDVVDTPDSPEPAVVPTWRARVVYETTRGSNGATWASAELCVDGRVDNEWYRPWIDAPGPCRIVGASPLSCVVGEGVSVSLIGGGVDQNLRWDINRRVHTATVRTPPARTVLGLRTTAWPDGPGALDLDPFLVVRPHDLVMTGAVPGAVEDALVLGEDDVVFSWAPRDADGLLVRLAGTGAPYEVVRCLVDDEDGAVTVPAALFAGWDPDQSVSISISQVFVSPAAEPAETIGAGVELHTWTGWGRVQ